jgi:carboxyl-terminal processing protease
MNAIKTFFKDRKLSRGVEVASLVVGAAVIFFLGILLGNRNIPMVDRVAGVFDKEPQITDAGQSAAAQADFGLFWRAWNVLNSDYITPASSTPQSKVYGAIEGLAQSYGDPYTVFMPPSEASTFDSEISGNFTGVGMELEVNSAGELIVQTPLKGNPAAEAGVMAGDIIEKINGTSTAGMTTDDAVNLIRGPNGTKVTLTLLRKSNPQSFNVTITRAVINTPEVEDSLRPDGVYVISLYTFTQNSPQLFAEALQRFVNSGSNKLILDLRGNPGGYLDSAVDIASWFLPPGKVVVREDYGGKQSEQEDMTTHNEIPVPQSIAGFKMEILVDGGSASAAEILSGALQEYGIAKLVGEQTFGKGSVQEVVNLTPNTNLKITIARWLTPNGTSISKKGITPDYVVPITQTDVDNGVDPQLNKAVSLLLGK